MNYYPSNTNGANGKNEYRIIKCFNSYNPYLHIGLFFLLFIGLNFSVFATELVSTRDINFKPYSAFDFRKNESFNKNNFHNSKISEKIAPFMVGAVHNVTQNLFYVLLQDAVNAANVNDVIELNGNITEALVNINKSITLNGNSFYLLSTSPNFGIEISATNINLLNLEIRSAGTFGIQTDCGADFLNLNNIFVNNCGGTGISIYGVDNAVLTNITSQDNGGNGINFTNCDNTTVNGLTTSGNNFPGGFEAGIGIFTSSIYCLPGGINGLTINGPISIAESTKAYSQKADASHIITGLSSNTTLFDWAVGIGALDRNYWPSKVVAYTVVDALFEAPYNYPNSVIYVVQVATEDFYVDDNPAGDPTPPMLISTAINFLIPGNIINIEDGSYNERLTVDKSLTLNGTSELGTILEGTGLIGNGSGILLNVGITNVSIQNLSIQNYNGNSPNAYAGIYGTGGNNSLTVNNCTIKNNIGGSGFYANGPVIGILLNNLDISGHTNAFGAARGIVIWNGFKQNITITNCDVYNNNCCGIELQDGTASGVLLSNNNVHDNADNGLGLSGLKGGAGANLIANNTVSNNGRFGIEIKNPSGNGSTTGDGSIYLDNNTVSLIPTVGMNNRDHAGIAIFRRAFQPGNPDGYVNIPTGVVLKNNTIDGFKHLNPGRVESEGFGIVIEGTNNEVNTNTIKNSDIGIQEQGGGHPNSNYVSDNAGDGDQVDSKSANYFGRGNAPVACGNEIVGNSFISNGLNQRTSGPGAGANGFVTNINTLETFCSIQAAINDAQTLDGHTLEVYSGIYNEQVLVNKTLTIKGVGATQPIVDFTGIVSGKPSLFDISANGVSIENINFKVDLAKLKSAIIATNSNLDLITIKDNLIDPYGPPSAGTYGDRNAVSVNYGGPTNYRVATGGVNVVNFLNNIVTAGTYPTMFRAGIAADEVGGLFNGNTLTTINHDIILRFGSNGNITISNNTISGGGVELTEQNAGAGQIDVIGNNFDATWANGLAPYSPILRLKNNYTFRPTLVDNNIFTNHQWGISLENYNTVTINNNSFTPLAGSTTYNHITINTKEFSSSSGFYPPNVDATITNNTFNNSGVLGGIALVFNNHDNDSPVFGNFAISSNNFMDNIATVIKLDNQSGPTMAPVTIMAPWTKDLDASNNSYDVGSGIKLPAVMSNTELYKLEDRIQHAIDIPGLGFVTVKLANSYVTTNSFVSPTTTSPSVQRGINELASLGTVNVEAGNNYTGGADATASGFDITLSPGASPACVTWSGNMLLNSGDILNVDINGTTACTLYDQFIVNGTVDLGGATLNINLGYVPANGDQIKIIDNDLVDVIVGQFAQGDYISSGGYAFTIDYFGGDGNDVVLTKCSGVINSNTSNVYCTIQDAINDPTTLNGHTLIVSAGLYAENIIVNKELIILGPNKDIDPCSGIRVGEANVVPAISGIASGEIFHIAASNVTISGLTIDGDNPYIVSGFTSTNGADIDAAEGITIYETGINNLTVSNNIIQNVSYSGITLYDYLFGLPSSGNEIKNNKIQDLGTYDISSGIVNYGLGILLYNNQYAHVADNCITNVRVGLQTGNFYLANPGALNNQLIENNSISARRRGIFHNLAYGTASEIKLNDNIISGISDVNETVWDGILFASLSVPCTATNNNVDGSAISNPSEGLEVWNVSTTSPTALIGGQIKGVNNGIFINNYEGYSSDANLGSNAIVEGVTVVPKSGGNGIWIYDSPSSSHVSVSATVQSDCEINQIDQSGTGILIQNSKASASIKDNVSSINGFLIGIDVDGGSATIEENHIYDNGIGVRFTNSGTGSVLTNKFFDALPNDKDLQATNSADAVLASPNNWFGGTSFGVENLSGPLNIDATLNYWNSASGPGLIAAGSGAKLTNFVSYCQWIGDAPVFWGGTGLPLSSPIVNITIDENSGINDDGIICNGATVDLDASTLGASSYQWSTMETTTGISVTPNMTTTYTVTVTFNDCQVVASQTITVNQLPACNINGLNLVCPNSSNIYSTAPGYTSYEWSIIGDGSISGPSNLESVLIIANNSCNGSYTLNLIITDINGCSSNCSLIVTVQDLVAPSLTGVAYPGTTGTNACLSNAVISAPFSAANAIQGYTDNCGSAVTASLTGTLVSGTNCGWTVTYTFSIIDSCGNTLTNQSYSNTGSDQTAPSLTGVPFPGTTGTNACLSNAVSSAPFNPVNARQGYTDNCGSPVRDGLTGTLVTGTNCGWTVTYTFSVIDSCGNVLTNQSYSNSGSDQTAPSLTGVPYPGTTGTNACLSNAVISAPFSAVNAIQGYSDNCGSAVTASLTNTSVSGTNCGWTVTYTFSIIDSCGNALLNRTYSNTGSDQTAPSLTGVPFPGTTGTNACLSNAISSAPFSAVSARQGYTDNCGSPIRAILTGTLLTGTNCGWTVTYTFSIIDSCGNTLPNRTYSNTGSDQTAPSLTGVPYPGTTGTNACLNNAVISAPFNAVNARQGYTDNCGSAVTASLTGTLVTGTNCGWTVTYTFSIIDSCGNALTNRTYSNTGRDQTAPSLTGVPYPGTTGTNACLTNAVISAPFSPANAIQGYTDNCGSAVTANLIGTLVTGTKCGWTITYRFSIIDSCGNTLTNRSYSNTGSDQTAPSLTGPAYPGTTGTNACLSNAVSSAPFNAVNAIQGYTDNCGGAVTASLTGTLVTGTNCGWTVTYTFSIIDSCGNAFTNRTYSNTGSDQTAPSLTGAAYLGTIGNNGCLSNATSSAPFSAANAIQGYTDNCGSAVTASLTGTLVTGTNCGWNVTYTFSIIDSCGNALTNQTYSNTGSDQTAPSLTGAAYTGTTGTNACLINAVSSAPFNAANAIQGYTDNCGSAVTTSLTGTLVSGTNCGWTVTYTFSIIDSCGNTLTNQSYSNTGSDQTAPSLTGAAYLGTSGTNACLSNAVSSAPFSATNAIQGYTDNCGSAVTASLTGTLVSGTNCGWTVTYTFSIIDSCGNALTNQTYSNTGSDQTAPSLTGAAYTGTTGTNACLINAVSSAPFSAANAIQGYTDNCGSAITASLTGTLVSGTNCGWTVTYTFSIIDSCGNTLTNQSYSNTGSDQTAPSLTGAAYLGTSGTNACLSNAVSSAPFSAANAIQGYTDNCGSAVTASLTGTLVSGTNCGWTVTYTFSIIDSCGNALINQSYSNSGSDQTAPSLTGVPYPGTTGTNACLTNAVISAPFSAANAIQGYSDNCGSAVSASLTGTLVTGTKCAWTITYTFSIIDSCGNTLTNQSYSNTGSDQTAPSLTGAPYPGTTGTNACLTNAVSSAPFSAANAIQGYTDNCGGAVAANLTGTAVTGTKCGWTVTYTFSIIDSCGNTLTNRSYSNTGSDQTAPSLTGVPFPGTTGTNACLSNAASSAPFRPVNAIQGYTDNCGGAVTASLTGTLVTGTNCGWTVTYTFSIIDSCGNALTNRTYSNTGRDQTAPSLTGVPFPGTTGTNACLSNAVSSAPFRPANAIQGYSDNCGSAVSASLTGTVVTGTKCGWTVTYTFSIIDSCGNALANRSYSNTGSDQTAPSLTGVPYPGTTGTNACLSNAVISAPFSPVSAVQGYTDNCGGAVTASLTGTVVRGTNCGWNITYTFSIIDSCGNTLTNRTYSNTGSDQTAPSLTGAPYLGTTGTNACLSNAVSSAPFSAANAIQGYTDNCGSAVTASLTGTLVSGTNCGWTVTYTFSIIDSCGNTLINQSYSNTGSDQTAPSLTGAPYLGTTGTNACLINAITSAPFSAANAIQGYTDNCGSAVTASLTGTLVTGTNCRWTITYTFSIIDSCGNALTNQTYSNTGSDQTAPSLTGAPYLGTSGTNACLINAITSAPFSAANAIQGYTDNCGSAVTASITDTLVTGTNCAWTVKYTFSVTDSCGNALTNQSYSNTGSDQSTFSIVCPAALSVKCASDVPTALPFTGTITNICSNNVDFDVDDVISNQTCANRYILTRTYTATDACNRVATCSRIITVFDDVQPSIICPANVFVKCASEVPVVDLTSVVTADGCGNAGVLVSHDQDIITPGSCINKFVINRTYRSTDVCNNTKTCVQVITVNDVDPPIAICKDITVVLDLTGNKIIRSNDINNGSGDNCGNNTITLFASDTAFNCSEIGINLITLTVYDLCNNSSTCVSTVTVREDIKPILFCPTLTDIQLKPGECGRFITFIEPYATDNCDLSPRVEQIDTTGLKSGDFFPGGIHCLKYRATDFSGNSTECTFCIELKLFNNPIKQLSCNDDVQISLDDSCKATVSADLILVGGPYSCYNDYIVQIKYASGGGLIDRDLNKAGTQIDYRDLGKQLIITVIDPRTGNSCWGKAFVEDKLPPVLICPKDTIIDCSSGTLPITTGQPYVYESCGQFNLSYVDQITNGSCLEGFEQIIHRTWIAIDNYGNKATCIQTITVKYADINQIVMPLDYNGYITPTGTHSLSCDEKYDEFFDLLKHLKPSTDCIDDYLLDNVEFIKTGRRIPKTLGWNIIKTGPYAGHPNTESIYYPVHKDSNQCWKSNEIIMWEGTGTPKVSGCANIGVSYTDIVITTSKAGCDAGSVGCYKLLRKWTILDWCTNKIRTYEQIIKVDDLEGPKILYPDTLDLPARANSCDAQWEVKNIWLTDNCSNEVHYTINVIYGTVLGNDHSGYVIIDIPFGEQYVTIVAEDCCGNVTEKRILLRVTDVTPPTAICQSKTVTSIVASSSPSENYSTIKVKSLDDGSFDNCANKVYFKAIRMDELQGTNNGSNIESNVCFNLNGDDNSKIVGSQSYFDDEVKFCCADVSSTKMVVFRVFDIDPGVGPVLPTRMNPGGDLFGHFSDCMIEVEVQNKSNPKLEAPADLVISCDYWFDVNRLIDPKDSLFGKMVNDLAWRKKVSTTDIVCESFCINNLLTKYPGGLAPSNSAPFIACDAYNKLFDSNHPDTKYNLVWGFDGYILSACGTNFTISIDDQRHCGQGKIIRTFSTTGQGGQSISVNQTIWVVDCDPFYINDNDACDTLDDIIWPDCSENGTIVSGCGANTSPDNIGRPIIVKGADDHCSLIAIVNTDQLFTTQTDACFVILRKWVVIDWCQYDPNISATKGRWEFSQYIKVRDVESPIVNCTMGDCEPASINSTSQICYGHINLKATAIDSCTPSELLSFEYKIDLYNDGTNDLQVGTLNTVEFNAGNKPQTTNNPNADNKNNPFDASGNYPIGVHKISWYITDGCGNVGTCSKLFEIKDCKAPTPYCLPGIVTVPMTTTKCVDIWAKDLNFASFDNCTPKENLKYYFNGDSKKTSIRICCEDFVKAGQNDELKINVEMWVEDQEGNKDFCNTVVIVQDNLDSCMNKKTLGKIVGSLAKEGGEEIKLASVQLELDSALMREVSASPYRFTDLELNKEYTVIPIRNDEPLNGVSTVDIVKLQKHILGKANIKSPYELIAADVNASGSITSADISEIRKLILGIIPQFAKVPSWTFVPESYVFPETNLPWNAPRKEKMNVTKEEEYKANFVAIKMGDLNGNANAGYQKAQVRTNGVLNLEIASNELKLGEIYKMEIKSSNFAGISGFQFTLNYDNQSLQFAGIESGVLNMKESNIGNFNNGILTTSWNSDNAESHKSDEVLYSILFKVNQSGTMSKLIALSSDITKAEAYNVQDQTLDVRLGSRKEEGLISTSLFELYQNEPNPFERECIINYRLPEASWAKLTIYDATGRILRIYELDGQKGLNTHKISRTELGNSSGLLYYQLDDAGHTATKRMMLIN